MNADHFSELFERFIAEVAIKVAETLQHGGPRYFDQRDSPLGPRHHIAAISSGKMPGRKLGRRYVAAAADVDAYIRQSNAAISEVGPLDEADQLADELGLRKPKGDID
jgi:hypothetical protein